MREKSDWRILLEESPPIMPGDFEELWNNTVVQIQCLQENSFLSDGYRVLDFGCGNGRLAMLMPALNIEYVGIDIHAPSIDFCTHAFAPWTHCTFRHLDVRHRLYNPYGVIPEDLLSLPFRSASFDSLIAGSVFTHLENEAIAVRCLQEIFRVLKPGGRFFCSWFRSPPNSTSWDPYRTVFAESAIRHMLRKFEWLADRDGQSEARHDQWAIFLRKPKK